MSTSRFEQKHRFLKDVIHKGKNTINFLKTCSMRHQRYVAHLVYNGLFDDELLLSGASQKAFDMCATKKKVSPLTKSIADLAIALSPDCVVSRNIEYKGTKYREGQYVVMDLDTEEFSLSLGKIYKCVVNEKRELHFIVRQFKAFLSVHSFYRINEPGSLLVVRVDDLIDYYPLSEIKSFPKTIVLHHHVSK